MYKCASSFNGITVSQGKEQFLKNIYAKLKLPSTAISATIQLYNRTYLSIQPNISLAMARVDLVPTVITQLEPRKYDQFNFIFPIKWKNLVRYQADTSSIPSMRESLRRGGKLHFC